LDYIHILIAVIEIRIPTARKWGTIKSLKRYDGIKKEKSERIGEDRKRKKSTNAIGGGSLLLVHRGIGIELATLFTLPSQGDLCIDQRERAFPRITNVAGIMRIRGERLKQGVWRAFVGSAHHDAKMCQRAGGVLGDADWVAFA